MTEIGKKSFFLNEVRETFQSISSSSFSHATRSLNRLNVNRLRMTQNVHLVEMAQIELTDERLSQQHTTRFDELNILIHPALI